MKCLLGILGGAAIVAFAGLVQAEGEPKPGEGPVSREQLQKLLLEKFDANGDGTLSGQELANAQAAAKQVGGGFGPAGAAFDQFKMKFDLDRDGKLNVQEQSAALAAFKKARGNGGGPATGGLPGGNAGGIPAGGGFGGGGFGGGGVGGAATGEGKSRGRDAMIKRFDKNGDGKLSDDEKAEAQKALKGKKGERPASKLTETMKEFDADGDGVLSEEEKAEMKKELAARKKEKGKKPE